MGAASEGIMDVLEDLQDKAEKEQAELRKKEMNSQHLEFPMGFA